MVDQELKELILKNRESLKKLEANVAKIQRKMMWNTIGGILKIILIVGPIVLGVIYFLPFVRGYFNALEPLLNAFHLSPNTFNEVLSNNANSSASLSEEELRALVEKYCDK